MNEIFVDIKEADYIETQIVGLCATTSVVVKIEDMKTIIVNAWLN